VTATSLPATPPDPAAPPDRASALERLLHPYAQVRKLSRRQHRVFRLYLEGKADKEIAHILGCAAATVYEHWRRMARKAGGRNKSDAISDFHHFLGDRIT
jgi:DNA-binding CsgD family transcriptional regulator